MDRNASQRRRRIRKNRAPEPQAAAVQQTQAEITSQAATSKQGAAAQPQLQATENTLARAIQPPEQPQDLYSLLVVKTDASEREIKLSFNKLALRSHTDRGLREKLSAVQIQENEALFKSLYSAYEILSDPVKRKAYDRERRQFTPSVVPQLQQTSYKQQAEAQQKEQQKVEQVLRGGNRSEIEMLINSGADLLNISGSNQAVDLLPASRLRNHPLKSLVRKVAAEQNFRKLVSGEVDYEQVKKAIKAVVAAGGYIDAVDSEGSRALDLAVQARNIAAAQALIDHGANIWLEDGKRVDVSLREERSFDEGASPEDAAPPASEAEGIFGSLQASCEKKADAQLLSQRVDWVEKYRNYLEGSAGRGIDSTAVEGDDERSKAKRDLVRKFAMSQSCFQNSSSKDREAAVDELTDAICQNADLSAGIDKQVPETKPTRFSNRNKKIAIFVLLSLAVGVGFTAFGMALGFTAKTALIKVVSHSLYMRPVLVGYCGKAALGAIATMVMGFAVVKGVQSSWSKRTAMAKMSKLTDYVEKSVGTLLSKQEQEQKRKDAVSVRQKFGQEVPALAVMRKLGDNEEFKAVKGATERLDKVRAVSLLRFPTALVLDGALGEVFQVAKALQSEIQAQTRVSELLGGQENLEDIQDQVQEGLNSAMDVLETKQTELTQMGPIGQGAVTPEIESKEKEVEKAKVLQEVAVRVNDIIKKVQDTNMGCEAAKKSLASLDAAMDDVSTIRKALVRQKDRGASASPAVGV